ncbi:MAG: hypothetical protein AB1393_13560 [Candidatus Edwardsbacteria bacterium]
MVELNGKQEILKEIDRLPPDLQQRVLEFARTLNSTFPEGTPGKEILRFAGILTPEEADLMERAIKECCE